MQNNRFRFMPFGRSGDGMSLDIFMISFRDGEDVCGDADAAGRVVQRSDFRHEPEHGFYQVSFPDNSKLDLYVGGHKDDAAFGSVMASLHGYTEKMGEFLYDLAFAGGYVLFPTWDVPIVLTHRSDYAHLPNDVKEKFDAVFVADSGGLNYVLSDAYELFASYRDHVFPITRSGFT